MKRGSLITNLSLAVAALLWGVSPAHAQSQGPVPGNVINYDVPNYANSPLPKMTGALASIRITDPGCGFSQVPLVVVDAPTAVGGVRATATVELVNGSISAINIVNPGSGYDVVPNVTIDLSNGATCKCPASASAVMEVEAGTGLRKFINGLPGLNAPNDLGQSVPVAVSDPVTYAGSDYYEIALVDYREQMHGDLPAVTVDPADSSKITGGGTRLRGYVQLSTQQVPGKSVKLWYPDGTPIMVGGKQATAVEKPQYLGPIIVAHRDRPVRVKFLNLLKPDSNLPDGQRQSDLFIPVDTTLMGSGEGGWALVPDLQNPGSWKQDYQAGMYPQSRATLHLHGGLTPWISDGTPHQWTVPVGDTSFYQKGVSTVDVPDMASTSGQGIMTFYWPNQQSGRLMFYHDHSWGTTRLNVYVGSAAGYLLVDDKEENAFTAMVKPDPADNTKTVSAGFPAIQIPLVFQDRTFVWGTKPTGNTPGTGTYAGDPTWGSLEPDSVTGDLWWPHIYQANQNPADALTGSNGLGRWDYGPWFWPPQIQAGLKPMPVVSTTPEAFMDTPLVNGTAYPYVNVPATKVRLRILNASNDRFVNLQLYQADPDLAANRNNGFSTEVAMVPAVPNPNIPFPPVWKTQTVGMIPEVLDGRPGGVPDPRLRGPAMIQIGTEGGLLPSPALLPNTPVGYEQNKRNIVVLNVTQKTLFIAPAERADVIVDFTHFAGKTIILYNDSPAPVPAGDPRLSYYTGNPDFSITADASGNYQGGAPTTLPGYGPNIRTIMQIRVDATTPGSDSTAPVDDYDPALLAALEAEMPKMFKDRGEMPVVPEPDYVTATGGHSDVGNYVRIQDTSLTWINPTNTVGPVTNLLGGSGYTAAPLVDISAPTGAGGVQATAVAILGPLVNGVGSVIAVEIVNPGAGYTTLPTITIAAPATVGGVQATATATRGLITMPMQPKAIHELFDTYGRMNSVLGVEVPFTSFLNQTTIPYQYIDPTTETIPMGQTQIWKITHNGVDSHVIHFHLLNMQIINRVGWDGAVRPPDANELGWKESIRMNPLEDCIVAAKAVAPTLPWPLPSSIRPLDPSMPLDDPNGAGGQQFTGVDTQNRPIAVYNAMTDFSWEYVWHCHILGHEENDMMRPLVMTVAQNDLSYVKDTIPPSISVTPDSLPNAQGWYNVPVGLTFTATDNVSGSGIASISYAIGNGGNTVATAPAGFNQTWTKAVIPAVTADGSTVVTYFATDAANNNSTALQSTINVNTTLTPLFLGTTVANAPASLTIRIDTIKPTVSASFAPAPANGVVNVADPVATPVVVTLSATDVGGSGIASITYNVNNTGWSTPATASPASFNLTAYGDYTIAFAATDMAGNVQTGSSLVTVSPMGPVLQWGQVPKLPASGWFNAPVTIAWFADVAPPSYLLTTTPAWMFAMPVGLTPTTAFGYGTVTQEGAAATTTASATDNNGVTTFVNSPAVPLDMTAPTVTGVAVTPTPNAAGWNNSNVSVSYTVVDPLSGVKTPNPAIGSLSYTVDGLYTAQTLAVSDNAGNSGVVAMPNVSLDMTLPTAVLSPAPNVSGWYNNTTFPVTGSVSLTVSDALSGLASASYRVNGAGTPTSLVGLAPVITVLNNGGDGGTAVYNVTAADVAGNSGTTNVTVKVDRQPPGLARVVSPAAVNSWNKDASVTLTLTGSDPGGVDVRSGVSNLTYTITTTLKGGTAVVGTPVVVPPPAGSAPATGTPTVLTFTSEGRYAVACTQLDYAGNTTTQNQNILIDRTAPAWGVVNNPNPATGTRATTGSASVVISGSGVTDGTPTTAVSGVATGTYTVTNPLGVVTGPTSFTVGGTGTFSIRLTIPLQTLGTYTITLNMADRAGNAGPTITKSFTVVP